MPAAFLANTEEKRGSVNGRRNFKPLQAGSVLALCAPLRLLFRSFIFARLVLARLEFLGLLVLAGGLAVRPHDCFRFDGGQAAKGDDRAQQ